MTDKYLFIQKLKSVLPEDTWSWVIPALRQDTLVWNCLQEKNFYDQAVLQIGSDPEKWSPATLVLLVLNLPPQTSIASLEPELYQDAGRTYEEFIQLEPEAASDKITLKDAGLLAIALAERSKENGCWEGLPGDLQPVPLTIWKTPLACLYGFTDDRSGMIEALLQADSNGGFQDLAIHAILSTPLPLSEHAKTLHTILNDLPLRECVRLLSRLKKFRPHFAAKLARLFLEKQKPQSNQARFTNYPEFLAQISNLLENAEIHIIANLPSQAAALHSKALEKIKSLHGAVSKQLANAFAEKGDLETAMTSWHGSGDIEADYELIHERMAPIDLVLALLKNEHYQDALALIDQQPSGEDIFYQVLYRLTSAHLLYSQGSLKPAQKQARLALENLRSITSSDTHPYEKAVDLNSDAILELILDLASLLLDLSLTLEAIQAYNFALELCPDEPRVLAAKPRAQRNAGDSLGAAFTSHLAVGLVPDDPELRRELITSLEAIDDWESAYEERKILLQDRFCKSNCSEWPRAEDLKDLANCALKAGHPDHSIEICQQHLDEDPYDVQALAILGEAFAAVGNYQSALNHLQKATQFALHQSEPWLALARVRKAAGETAKAIETLRAASNAIPDDPAILYALAQAYLEENSLTPAVANLRRGYELVASSPSATQQGDDNLAVSIALRLGQTLTQLGHLEEARDILERAYQAHPIFPNLAYAYGQTLLRLKEPLAALEPLQVAIQDSPEAPEIYIDYAQALLATQDKFEEAVHVLKKALQLIKDGPDIEATAHGLLAEALAGCGDYNAALQSYYLALEGTERRDPTWRGRLSFGLGQVALELHQPEIAIANLQEAARLDAKNPAIYRKLSQAYTETELYEDALEAARTAQGLAPQDVELLSWFADQAIRVDEQDEAITALLRATQIDPQRSDLLIQLAKIYAQSGEQQAALETLRKTLAIEEIDPEDAYQAAQWMLQLGDPVSAAACLELAKNRSPAPSFQLLYTLAQAYQRAGEIEHSLETIEFALRLNPGNLDLYLIKAELLDSQNRLGEAEETLKQALKLHPDHPEVHLHAARILRQEAQLLQALENAEQVIEAYTATPLDARALAARAIAAEIAQALLNIGHARALLRLGIDNNEERDGDGEERQKLSSVPMQPSEDQPPVEGIQALSYYCLAAELALEEDEEIAAAGALTHAFELAPDHPRVVALQARLTLRRGDHATAVQSLQMALEATGREEKPLSHPTFTSTENPLESTDFLSVASAAIEFRQWDVALYLIRRSIGLAPKEPFPYLQLASTLVLRAEYQRLCEKLDVITHSPGQTAHAQAAYRSFKEAMQNAIKYLPRDQHKGEEKEPLAIQRWRARGMAVFQPGRASLQKMEKLPSYTPGDWSARIALLRQLGDMGGVAQLYKRSQEGTNPLPKHHLVSAQLALSLGYNGRRHNDLNESIQAARAAIEQQPAQALYHYLLAMLAHRQEDIDTALRAAQTALSIWPEEPRWQALAADLHMTSGDTTSAIGHLKKATQQEPQHIPHHLALGDAYLEHGDIEEALKIFDRAHHIDPGDLQPQLSLARAYLLNNDLPKAAAWADKAATRSINQIEPLLLRAEIALQAHEPETALEYTQAALELTPDHEEALHLRARALKLSGRLEDALKVLEKALTRTEEPLPLQLEIIELLETNQGPGAALAALQELADRYPDEAAILTRLARAFHAAGHREQAIHTAQQALRCDPLSRQDRAQMLYLLGQLLRQSGQLDQAIYQLNEAIRLDPTSVEFYLELGGTHQDRREHAQALATYQKAIEIAHQDPRPYYQAGLLLKESHDFQGAEEMLRRAANLAHDDVNIHRQWGAIVALNLVHNPRNLTVDL